MSSKTKKSRGISVEEKKIRAQDFLQEKKECYQLKDLEKLLPKHKSITSMSVKDVLKNLVDDDMIESDKVGLSVYFWSFPAKKSENLKMQKSKLENDVETLESELKKYKSTVETKQSSYVDSPDRTEILQILEKNKQKLSCLENDLEVYQNNDPEKIIKLETENKDLVQQINDTTDGIFSTISWCVRKFGKEKSMVHRGFGVPSDIDYVT